MLRSRAYGWYVLWLFASLNFVSYANRNVVLSMYGDLRDAFDFTGAELGLLTTFYMVSHALVAIPAGWAADRFDRRRVIAVGAVVWSFGALACALATSQGSMFLGRALAGLGTGALVPVANALLCDVFPREAKARTVSIFNVGLFLGGAAGFGIGLLGHPLAIFVVALPGFGLAYLVAVVRVPPNAGRVAPGTERMTWRAFVADCLSLSSVRTLWYVLGGSALVTFAAGGYLAWFVEFIERYKDLSRSTATAFFGASALTGGLLGVLAGGAVGDWLYARRSYGRLIAISIGLVAAVPFALIALYMDSGPAFFIASWLLMFFMTWYHGPMAAVVDDVVPAERAATAQAIMICLMHLLGTASSAWVVGVTADELGLRNALLVPTGALVASALVFASGWRAIGPDTAAARPS